MFFNTDETNTDDEAMAKSSESENSSDGDSSDKQEESSTEDNSSKTSETDMSDRSDMDDESNQQGKDSKSEDDEDGGEEEISIKDVISELTDADDSLQKSEETIAKIENAGGTVSDSDIEILKSENARQRESINILEGQLKKLYNDKADLTLKNAEMEAFGWNYKDPKLLIMVKNYDKASGGDDKAKQKVISICRDMIESLTWVIDTGEDPIGAAAIYNKTSLKMPEKKGQDDNSGFLL